MFTQFEHYEEPKVTKVNESCTMAIHYPKSKKKDAIIEIYNRHTDSRVQLFSNTLTSIANIFIKDVLSNSDRFFFNKKITKKTDKKGNKK